MKLLSSTTDALIFEGDLLVIFRFEGGKPSSTEEAIDQALGGALGKATARTLFKGKPRQSVALDTLGQLPVGRILLLGLGEREKIKPELLRDYGAAAALEALKLRLSKLAVEIPQSAVEVVSGLMMGAYRFDLLKSPDPDEPRHEILSVAFLGAEEEEVQRGQLLGEAVNHARDLLNEPPNVCTPERLAAFAEEIASLEGISLKVLDAEEIKAEGMGGLLAVSQGAARPPRFIHLSYTPEGGSLEGAIAFVGKGLTFDSGGLSIKPSAGMTEMHMDMGGAAAVLGAMWAIARLRPASPVHAIVPACENMPDGNSYRVSDVLTMYSGKTVEVLNTDAEGRLVLADALHYATQLEPTPRGIIDLATLTGACVVALGNYYTGVFSDDEPLAEELLAAGKRAGEGLWRMPLHSKIAEQLKSKRADMSNLGERWGGAISAAHFLQEFKGELPWVHMDIAGPAMVEKDDGYIRAGGTGHGVLTLVALAEKHQPER